MGFNHVGMRLLRLNVDQKLPSWWMLIRPIEKVEILADELTDPNGKICEYFSSAIIQEILCEYLSVFLTNSLWVFVSIFYQYSVSINQETPCDYFSAIMQELLCRVKFFECLPQRRLMLTSCLSRGWISNLQYWTLVWAQKKLELDFKLRRALDVAKLAIWSVVTQKRLLQKKSSVLTLIHQGASRQTLSGLLSSTSFCQIRQISASQDS